MPFNMFDFLNEFEPVDESLKQQLEPYFEQKTFKKGDVLCREGEVPEVCYFLNDGIVRGYLKHQDHKEYNRVFFTKHEMMASFSALIQKIPSAITLECLTDCEVLVIDYEQIIRLEEQYTVLYKIHIKVLEEFFIKRETEIIQLATMDATRRYLSLRQRIPQLDNKIPQFHIASYLGITPVQLSRIRKKLLQNG
ncbi:MAG: hypothetical protein CR968_04105 [Flavobacteriia bacterium]|nr:MAG: hypothetical protein CR968_04105 [Flavobacteriia bacterium]